MTPTTETGHADHDSAWDAAYLAEDWPIEHVRDRENCPGCEHIARIEAEAAAKERDLVRGAMASSLTRFIMKSGWVERYEQARAEAESFLQEALP